MELNLGRWLKAGLKHDVLEALAAGGLLVPAVAQQRVDLAHRRLAVLALRLPQQAVVGDALGVAALERVVGRGRRLGRRALQVHWGGDGAGGLAPVAGLAHGAPVGLGAAHMRLLSPLALKVPTPLAAVVGAVFTEGGKSSLGRGRAVLVVGHVHRGGFDGQSDDGAAVLGRFGARRHRHAGHPAAVGVAQDAALVLAVEAVTGI